MFLKDISLSSLFCFVLFMLSDDLARTKSLLSTAISTTEREKNLFNP